MNDADNITRPVSTEGLHELETHFQSMRRPYALRDILEFNAIYRRLYPRLKREEKWIAETLVDELIEGIADQDWACRIFGVV